MNALMTEKGNQTPSVPLSIY